jgi:hypothetical protein
MSNSVIRDLRRLAADRVMTALMDVEQLADDPNGKLEIAILSLSALIGHTAGIYTAIQGLPLTAEFQREFSHAVIDLAADVSVASHQSGSTTKP